MASCTCVRRVFSLAVVIFCMLQLNASDDAEKIVRENVARLGRKIGFNRDRKEVVFVGRALFEENSPEKDDSFLHYRDWYFKLAELKAKAALIRYLRQTQVGEEYVSSNVGSGKCTRKIESIAGMFAANSLSGWHVLTSAESYQDGLYVAAVAVVWSPTLEAAARRIREGRIFAADAYRSELKEWLKDQNLNTWSGCRVFVDSNGFPHLLGVGIGDAETKSPLEEKALQMKCDLWARKNLLLGLFGDSECQRFARTVVSTESADSKDFDSESFFKSMASIEVKGRTVEGMTFVHECIVPNDLTGRKMLIVLYGIEPSKLYRKLQTEQGKELEDEDGTQQKSSGIMVWNPNTGKFEKR